MQLIHINTEKKKGEKLRLWEDATTMFLYYIPHMAHLCNSYRFHAEIILRSNFTGAAVFKLRSRSLCILY